MNSLRSTVVGRGFLGVALLGSGLGSIEGSVFDQRGAHAPGVRVLIGEVCHAIIYYNAPDGAFTATPGVPDGERAQYAAELTTDAQGRFVASGLSAGDYSILALDGERGFAIGRAQVGGGDPSRVDLALQPPSWLEVEIHGLAFDPRCHVVELSPIGTGANFKIVPRLTKDTKSWSFQSAPLPRVDGWRVTGTELVPAQDYSATLFSLPVSIAPGKRKQLMANFAEFAGDNLTGTVVDREGRPLSGVSVVFTGPDEASAERGAVTDAKGEYRITGMARGRYTGEIGRWNSRQIPGCGRGARDVAHSQRIEFRSNEPRRADFQVDVLAGGLQLGEPAPQFRAQTIDGRTIDLAEMRGKVVLVDFWATWCPMCRMELPRLVKAYAQLAEGGRFEIVGVSVDEDAALVPRFAAGRGLPWPQTALGPIQTNPVARLYGVNSTPSTVLVDAQGRIAALNLTGEPLLAKIAETLGGR